MEFQFKRATIADIDELTDTRIEALKAANQLTELDDEQRIREDTYNYYRKALQEDSHAAYLVYISREFVGCGGICFYELMPTVNNPSGKKAYIMNMYTRPNYRRKGIGMITLDMLVKEAKKRGVSGITLEATEMGRPLYEAYGFGNLQDEMVFLKEKGKL